MNLKQLLLNQAFIYFNFNPCNAELAEYNSLLGINPFPNILNRENIDSYELYDISGSFQLALIDYSQEFYTSVFLDMSSQALAYEKTGTRNISQLHKHKYFELVYVVDGQLDLMIEGIHHRLLPCDACIINTNARHIEAHDSNYTAVYLSFKLEFLNEFKSDTQIRDDHAAELYEFFHRNQLFTEQIDFLIFNHITSIENTNESKIELIIDTLFKELLNKDIGFAEICKCYIQRIFAIFQLPSEYICSNTRFQQMSGNTIFDRTLNYINENKTKLSRKDLEEALHYNGNYISRVFQKHAGQTLADYIRDVCLSEAANLLLNSNLSIREIIQQIGYENKTVYYNHFKEKYGMTPQQYRHKRTSSIPKP